MKLFYALLLIPSMVSAGMPMLSPQSAGSLAQGSEPTANSNSSNANSHVAGAKGANSNSSASAGTSGSAIGKVVVEHEKTCTPKENHSFPTGFGDYKDTCKNRKRYSRPRVGFTWPGSSLVFSRQENGEMVMDHPTPRADRDTNDLSKGGNANAYTYNDSLKAKNPRDFKKGDPIRIGVRMVEPFATNENGWRGYVIQLIRQMMPNENIEFVPMLTLDYALTSVMDGDVDMAIGPFSKTEERENHLDFSHSFFETKPAIAVRARSTWVDSTIWIVQRIGIGILIFIVMLYIVGFIIDKVDGDTQINNIHDGAWWALVTFTTVGYGDKVPATQRGKTVGAIWMVASLFLIATFTGYMGSAMTIKRLADEPTSLKYLGTSKISTVDGSTSEEMLAALNFNYTAFDNVEDAVEKLKNGDVHAIIYDKPMLDYHLRDDDNYEVWEVPSASNEHYAFIFPEGSDLVEEMNRGLLRVLPTVEWQRIHNSYFK